jgi:hypothetical protein
VDLTRHPKFPLAFGELASGRFPHCLIVMHPHTKYNLPIWKDKKVVFRTSFAEKKQKKQKRKWKKKSD